MIPAIPYNTYNNASDFEMADKIKYLSLFTKALIEGCETLETLQFENCHTQFYSFLMPFHWIIDRYGFIVQFLFLNLNITSEPIVFWDIPLILCESL